MMIGVSRHSYWISWYILGFFYILIIYAVLIICALCAKVTFFIYTPLVLVYPLFISISFSFLAIGFFIITVSKDAQQGYTMVYTFILLAVLMEMLLTNVYLNYFLYVVDGNGFRKFVRYLFSLYPAFHYSKIYGDICKVSCNHFSV